MPSIDARAADYDRERTISPFVRLLAAIARLVLKLAVVASSLVLVGSLAAPLLDGGDQLIAAMRIWGTLYLAGVLAACIAYRVAFELAAGLVSVHGRSAVTPLLSRRWGRSWPLSWVTAAYAALLWLSCSHDVLRAAGGLHTFWYAAATTLIAAIAYLYGEKLPEHGYAIGDLLPQETNAPPAQVLASAQPPQPAAAPGQPRATELLPPAPSAGAAGSAPVVARGPALAFGDIHGMEQTKARLLDAAAQIVDPNRRLGQIPRNGILLHGEPGNGKTVLAEALAGEVGLPIVTLTFGDVASKWVGEVPRLVAATFAYVKGAGPCVFFIDEVDSFIRCRSDCHSAEDLKVANTILTQLVDIRHYPVVVVAATNFLDKLDAAAIREGRFDFKIEVPAPDEEARRGILQDAISRYAPRLRADAAALASVARRWDGFGASRLVAIARELPGVVGQASHLRIGFEDWMAALRLVQGRVNAAAGMRICELYLPPETAAGLELLIKRLAMRFQIEQRGGTLPVGVLLHGPSGTGKSTAAQALAAQSGWMLVSATGADLLAERGALEKLYRRACDLRPAIVFIEDADDALRHRSMSGAQSVVSSLLAVMKRASERGADVLFVAAVTDLEQLDPALFGAGRLSEALAFAPPTHSQLASAVRQWLLRKGVALDGPLTVDAIARGMANCTIADVHAALQTALNTVLMHIQSDCQPRLTASAMRDAMRGLRLCASPSAGCGQRSSRGREIAAVRVQTHTIPLRHGVG